jgi:hypothetical protein
VRLSSPFCLLHYHHAIPPIVLCPWITLMCCVKIEKVWEHQKYETIAWLVIGVVHDSILCVMKMEHSQTIWFCRDKLSLAMLFWEDMITLLVCLKYYCFYVNIKLLSWIFRIWIFIPQLRRITLKLCQVAFHIKNSVFIIYLLEDEQELSLGMLDTSPTYL